MLPVQCYLDSRITGCVPTEIQNIDPCHPLLFPEVLFDNCTAFTHMLSVWVPLNSLDDSNGWPKTLTESSYASAALYMQEAITVW